MHLIEHVFRKTGARFSGIRQTHLPTHGQSRLPAGTGAFGFVGGGSGAELCPLNQDTTTGLQIKVVERTLLPHKERKPIWRNLMKRATMLRMLVAILALLSAWMLNPSSVQAETETWEIRSNYPFKVQLQFYSKDRDAVWPGGGKSYLLYDSKMHEFSLDCRAGERICYGAWNVATGGKTGTKYWGVGQNNRKGCSDCCWTCGRKGNPRKINLTG